MLLERNVAPALTAIGASLLLPHAYAAAMGRPTAPSAGTLVLGCLFGAAGIFLSTLLAVSSGMWPWVRIVAGIVLGALTFAFVLGTGFYALHAIGVWSIVLALAALLPAFAFGVALVAVFKD